MDGKTLPRIGAIAFVAIAITITVIDMRQTPGSEAGAAPVVTAASEELWHAELKRCQSIGQAGASDAACLRAWAENRQRFLAPGKRAASMPPIAPVVRLVSATPGAIVNEDEGAHAPSATGAR